MIHRDNSSHSASHLAYPTPSRTSTLLQLGGGLSIAGCCVGLLIFFGACFGFGASLTLSPLPLIMGSIGLVVTVVGGVMDKHAEGPTVAAGLFISLASIVGALLEMAAWLNWKIFA